MKTPDLGERVMLDGALLEAAAARISPLSDGFMFGHGVFETINVVGGRLAFFAEHAERLGRSARELGLTVAPGLQERCAQTIAANGLTRGVLKIVVFRGENASSELILTRTFFYADEAYATGFRLRTFRDARTSEGVNGLKSLAYLKNSRARTAAREAGFDEALFVSPLGTVLEGAATNLFIVRDDEVFTPPLSAGILPGIARGVVLGLLDKNHREQTAVTAAMLRDADEVFVTNALLGVMPVARVDERIYSVNAADALTRKIAAGFRAAEQRSLERTTAAQP